MSGSTPAPESRRAGFAAAEESAASMAIEAGRQAIAKASLTATDIDGVIVATSTHFLQTPAVCPGGRDGVGCKGYSRGLMSRRGAPASDMRSASPPTWSAAGAPTRCWLSVRRNCRPTVDMQDRSNCFIFADGAAGVVLGETPNQGIGPTVWGTDGDQSNAIRQDIDWISYTQHPTGPRPYLRLEGSAVFRWAAFEMGKVGRQAMDAAGVRPDEIDVFVPHQANSRINEVLAKSLRVAAGRDCRQRYRAHRKHVGGLHSAGDGRITDDRGCEARRPCPAYRLRRRPELRRTGRPHAERLRALLLVAGGLSRTVSPRSLACSVSRSWRRRSPATARAAVARRRNGEQPDAQWHPDDEGEQHGNDDRELDHPE